MVLAHRRVPPNIRLKILNPLIGRTIQSHVFPIKFPTEVEPIIKDEGGKLLMVGVGSFGYSGTIGHTIIGQAPQDMHWNINDIDNHVVDADRKWNNDIVFLFTGQGSQYLSMGKELYCENEAYHKAMDQCESIHNVLTEWGSLLDIIFNTRNLATSNHINQRTSDTLI